ncbi:MAG: hypothetical protein FDZ69_09295 [Deltaproteobacteria bacterium]|nr:MAG: hypothetical protein FDZ69_09295 [Deltaproteobacteria bacterium]
MISADPKLRNYLRDLPTGYLLDLLVEPSDIDASAIHDVLFERGLDREELERLRQRRAASRLPRPHTLWRGARLFTLGSALLVTVFNLLTYYRLLHGASPLKGMLLALVAGGVFFGFFLGYKLTTHVYQGARHQLYCGFPLPVGTVDLQSGQEAIKPLPLMILCMTVNAVVGLALVLFPLFLIHHLLG